MAQPAVARSRRMVLAKKLETTYGTDIFAGAYTSADIIQCFGLQPNISQEEIENLSMAGDLGRGPSAIGLEQASVSFSMFLRGKGAAYSATVRPECDLPLRGCGFSSTVDVTPGAEKVTYVPTTTFESMTIYAVQENGSTLKMAGCFGTVDFSMRAGGQVEARFSFIGKLVGVSDVSFVDGSISGTPQYPVLKSAAFQIGATDYAPRIASLGLSAGVAVQRLLAINATGGLAGCYIADRRPVLTIDPEADTVANFDWFTKWQTSVLADCTFQAGATQYVRLKFAFLKLQIVNQGFAVRDGITTFPTSLLATLTSGLDDLSLVFD